MSQVSCPHCGERTQVNETKFDAWGFPYKYTDCVYCDGSIVYDGDEVRTYSEHFEEVLDKNI